MNEDEFLDLWLKNEEESEPTWLLEMIAQD